MAELPTDRDPTVREINDELIKTATSFEEATFALGRRRAKVLNAVLAVRPEEVDTGLPSRLSFPFD